MNKLNSSGSVGVLPLVSGITFLSFLDINLLIPIISLYASGIGAGTGAIGLIVGMYSIINTPTSLVAGRLIDRLGYKAPLTAGLLISTISMFSYSLTRLPFQLALVRAIHGIGGGLTSPATMSAITEHSGTMRRGKAMGFYGMSIALANLVGFALSGIVVSRFGYLTLFWFGTAMLGLGSALSILLPGPKESRSRTSGAHRGFRQMRSLLMRKGLAVSYSSIFAQYFAFGALVTLLPLYVRELGMEAFHVGMLMTAFTVMFIAVQFPSGAISDRIGRIMPVAAGLSLGIVSLFILPSLTTFPLLIAVMSLYGIGFGMLFPSASALVGDHSAPDERGIAMGVFHGLLTGGVAVGAVTIGWVAEISGIQQGLLSASTVMVMALILTLITRKAEIAGVTCL